MTFKVTGITRNNAGAVLGSQECFLFKYNSTTHLFTQVGSMVTSGSSDGVYTFGSLVDNDPAYCVATFKNGAPNVFDITDRNLTPAIEGGGAGLPATFDTPGNGIFVVPAGVTSLTMEAWGGGCGGNGSASNARGGGGGGYSKRTSTVTPGQNVYYHVAAGSLGAANIALAAEDSWVNTTANAVPTGTQGCIGGGGQAGDTLNTGGGIGSIGTTNFNGGNGIGGSSTNLGGGSCAGSAGNGLDCSFSTPSAQYGAPGGPPDGGAGGNGTAATGGQTPGAQPGGGGAGEWFSGNGSNGASGRVKFS